MAKSFTVLDNSLGLNYFYKTNLIGALTSGVGYLPILVGSVEDMVNKLIAKAGSEKIEKLLISGHGSPGKQAVGCGRNISNDSGDKSLQYDTIDFQLMGDAKKYLHRLRSIFTNDAVISLGGCNVAKDDGTKLLSLISYETDTFVEAGDAAQNLILPGWEGNVIRCYRDTYWVALSKW